MEREYIRLSDILDLEAFSRSLNNVSASLRRTEFNPLINQEEDLIYDEEDCCGDYTCVSCGGSIDEGDQYSSPNGDDIFCESCFNDTFSYCESCSKYEYCENMYDVNGDYYVCENCFKKHYKTCGSCDTIISKTEATYIEGEDYYVCESCLGDYISCDSCGDFYYHEKMVNKKDLWYCPDCVPEDEEDEED